MTNSPWKTWEDLGGSLLIKPNTETIVLSLRDILTKTLHRHFMKTLGNEKYFFL